MRYKDLKEGQVVWHIVGGKLDKDLKDHIPEIASWFVEQGITPLWGDNYGAEKDLTHPVKLLVDEIVRQSEGKIKPIRILQLGQERNKYSPDASKKVEEVLDENGQVIGYLDRSVQDCVMIYTSQQQDRVKAYYNNADGLMALNGGVGVGYEIVNALLLSLSGDLPPHFRPIVIDHKGKFKRFMRSYLDLLEKRVEPLEEKYFASDRYYSSPSDFVEREVLASDTDQV